MKTVIAGRVRERYEYKPELRLKMYPDNWR